MNSGVTSEYRKLTTLRSTWYTLTIAPALSAAVAAIGVHLLPTGDDVVLTDGARGVAEAMWFVASVVAILAGAGEFQHRTVLTTLLATPRRLPVLATKAVVIAAYGAVLTTLGIAAALAASLVTAELEGVAIQPGENASWAGLASAVLVGALFGVLASALGMITRSTALALTTLLLWRFVGEGLLPVITRNPGMANWTPSGAARSLVDPIGRATSALGGGLLLVGYVVLLGAVATMTFTRRDAG